VNSPPARKKSLHRPSPSFSHRSTIAAVDSINVIGHELCALKLDRGQGKMAAVNCLFVSVDFRFCCILLQIIWQRTNERTHSLKMLDVSFVQITGGRARAGAAEGHFSRQR
jgi:hypothetical protein